MQGHDLPARLGGDEFALLCLSAEGDAPPLDRARAIIGDLSSAIHVGAKRLHGRGVGLSRLDTSIRSLEELLINADLALYDAKRVGRGRAVVYGPALGDASRRLSQIELEAARGLQGRPVPSALPAQGGCQDHAARGRGGPDALEPPCWARWRRASSSRRPSAAG